MIHLCCCRRRVTQGNPGLSKVEEESEDSMEDISRSRRCQNIKSRKNPDVQCPYLASNGDYCLRHSKNPHSFFSSSNPCVGSADETTYNSHEQRIAAQKIQTFWRRLVPLFRFRSQGPAANAKDLAMNDTELYSMSSLATVPDLYFFSLSDSRKSIWGFDIRTLVHMMGLGVPLQNPYSREAFTESAMESLHQRIRWLRDRKYQVLHINTDVLTEEQIWNQRVLDVFLKIEALGYYASCEWFNDLGHTDHLRFFRHLYLIWEWRLGLTPAQKEDIVPGHLAPGSLRLFHFSPGDCDQRSKAWWQKNNLALIETFISRSPDKEQQKLGALYCLMALVKVSTRAARALPWIDAIINDT